MEKNKTLIVRIPEDLKEKIEEEALGGSLGRKMSQVVRDILEQYFEEKHAESA